MPYTPKNHWYIPDKGKLDWYEDFKHLINDIDAQLGGGGGDISQYIIKNGFFRRWSGSKVTLKLLKTDNDNITITKLNDNTFSYTLNTADITITGSEGDVYIVYIDTNDTEPIDLQTVELQNYAKTDTIIPLFAVIFVNYNGALTGEVVLLSGITARVEDRVGLTSGHWVYSTPTPTYTFDFEGDACAVEDGSVCFSNITSYSDTYYKIGNQSAVADGTPQLIGLFNKPKWTISLWLYMNRGVDATKDAARGYLLYFNSDNYIYTYDENQLYAKLFGVQIQWDALVQEKIFYNFTVTYDGSKLYAYINGELLHSQSGTVNFSDLSIGYNKIQLSLIMDYAVYYDDFVSETDIRNLFMNVVNSGTDTDLPDFKYNFDGNFTVNDPITTYYRDTGNRQYLGYSPKHLIGNGNELQLTNNVADGNGAFDGSNKGALVQGNAGTTTVDYFYTLPDNNCPPDNLQRCTIHYHVNNIDNELLNYRNITFSFDFKPSAVDGALFGTPFKIEFDKSNDILHLSRFHIGHRYGSCYDMLYSKEFTNIPINVDWASDNWHNCTIVSTVSNCLTNCGSNGNCAQKYNLRIYINGGLIYNVRDTYLSNTTDITQVGTEQWSVEKGNYAGLVINSDNFIVGNLQYGTSDDVCPGESSLYCTIENDMGGSYFINSNSTNIIDNIRIWLKGLTDYEVSKINELDTL